MFKTQPRRHKQTGFTIVEALIALAVMGFGLLSLASMQLKLAGTGDVARQRTEAIRLAEQKIEELRSFTGISSGTINWNGLVPKVTVSGTDTYPPVTDNITPSTYLAGSTNGTNVSYTRTWTLGGLTTDPMRTASVSVAWINRAGEAQSVTLSTVISKSDPSDSGFLTFPLQQNTNLKLPGNRNINIPIPSIDLGGGKSALVIQSGVTLVFSNVTAGIIQKCSGTVTAATYAADAGNGATVGCSDFLGYVLSGYVSGAITTSPLMPTGIDTSSITGSNGTISCVFGPAPDPLHPGSYITGYDYYLCAIPVALNQTWSGRIRLKGVLNPTATYKTLLVCRFPYGSSLQNNNENNSNALSTQYVSVNESLDNQNYYILADTLTANASCPTITASGGTVANGGAVLTTVFQTCTTAVLSSGTSDCPPP